MYTLHRVAVTEYNQDRNFAMRNKDGEAFELYDEEDMRALYEMLKGYFERGEISEEPVEIEELESHWKGIWSAVSIARVYAPAAYTEDQIMARLLRDAAAGRIQHAHLGIDGKTWWFSAGGLERYLGALHWGERRPLPATSYPTVTVADGPLGIGHRTLAHALDDGEEVAHQEAGVWYQLYLDAEDRIVGVVDEAHYRLLGLPIPPAVSGQPLARPAERKAANAILRAYGYHWERHDEDWLEAHGVTDRAPGWYLYAGERELGMGDDAVDRAFAEINKGAAVAT